MYTDSERLRFLGQVQLGQLIMLGITVLGTLVVLIAGSIAPEFFDYRYLYVSHTFFADVLRFWPMVVWGSAVTLFFSFKNNVRSTMHDEQLLTTGLMTSVGAGVTEELWYRGVGVFFAMIALVIGNWFFGVAGWLVVGFYVIVVIIATLALSTTPSLRQPLQILFMLIGLVVGGASSYAILAYGQDPLYKLYEHVFIPVVDFTTLGLMKPVLYGDHQAFLVMGMISANFAFRDGHKYQGPLGWTNSWFMGCVLIYATLSYGLPVAIAVHALYDVAIDLVKYGHRKLSGRVAL